MATEKTCFKCNVLKPLSEFYPHPMMADGHLNKCKECAKRDVREHRAANDSVREYDRARGLLPHRIAKNKIITQRWRKAHPERRAAHMAVQYAVRAGRLAPLPCWICGERAEAHHPDYNSPLDVVWLCPRHHRQAHAMVRGLMGTQRNGYFLKDGTRVPSVTTITGRYKESGGIVHWAWTLGKEGKDYREVRDDAASAGTMAHEAVEAWIKGEQPKFEGPEEICARAKNAFGNFLEWADRSQLRVDKQEMPLISEKYGFGGTFDAILVCGKRAMGDWKTSNGLYSDYLIQIAAYGLLWEENFPDEPITGGYDLLRFDKTHGDFTHKHWDELESAKRSFILLREAYDLDKELKQRISISKRSVSWR